MGSTDAGLSARFFGDVDLSSFFKGAVDVLEGVVLGIVCGGLS